MQSVLKFELGSDADPGALQEDIALAIFAAECIFGRPRMRLETSYVVSDDGRVCVLSSDGDAGDAAVRIFTGLTAVRVGEDSYSITRVAASS